MRSSVKQGGFTLIELVVVITILGILAAFAVPRFISLEVQAQEASIEALEGSVRAGSALAHALWLATGQTSPVTMEGVDVALDGNGYPTAASIGDTLQDLSGYALAVADPTATFTSDSNSACTVTYTEPVAPAVVPTIAGSC